MQVFGKIRQVLKGLKSYYVYVVVPLKNSEVQLVLQDKNKIEKIEPESNLGTPSIML